MKKKEFTTRLDELLRKYEPENPESFNQLISHVYDCLHRKAHTLLLSEDLIHRWRQTDDIIQNTLVSLERSLRNHCPKTKKDFLHLAGCVIQHAIVDMARTLRKKNGMEANHYSPQNTDGIHHPTPPAEGQCENNAVMWIDIDDLIENTLDDPQLRDITRMYLFMNMTLDEIAETLGTSCSTVKRQWRKIRTFLAIQFQKDKESNGPH